MKNIRPQRYWHMMALAAIAHGAAVSAARADVMQQAGMTTVRISSERAQAAALDFSNAIPMALPSVGAAGTPEVRVDLASALSVQAAPRQQGIVVTGAKGNGKRFPVRIPKRSGPVTDIITQESGTTDHPFSTVRNNTPKNTNTSYPSRASGKLFFISGGSTYICSASLIKRGVVVTAAHCVAEFGGRTYYANWQFVPGYRNGEAPYGVWTAASATVLSSYYDGTDACYAQAPGVVCQNDVALITLNPKDGDYVGSSTGWYGYGWDGYGFTSGQLSQITQIGYPACLDRGQFQQRTDSYGYSSPTFQDNTIIGSLMCGGSSGGPWLVNFGTRPKLTGTTPGSSSDANVVVGVTSWGYQHLGPKEMGASRFTASNIKVLIEWVCKETPAACS